MFKFRWHPKGLVSARTRTDDASLRSGLSWTSICWQKLAFRTITSDVSRSYEPPKLEVPSLSPEHDIYISTSTNPYFNLTLEDWLFRHSSPSSPLLLIYRDSPCVIIGRNQNPWAEVNFTALRAARIPCIRRRSGGGTVYHDLGNTNFSLHLPRSSFDRYATGNLILQAVRSLGVDARVNERNDICVGTNKHISGSAYKLANQRSYHHGTMLIATRLDYLGEVLRPEKKNMITKGVSSVRSPVCNLEQFDASITHESFTSAVIEEFRKAYRINTKCCMVDDLTGAQDIEYIRQGMSELSTWDWAFGQTPEFTQTLEHTFSWGDVTAQIRSKHGLILDCSLEITNPSITSSAIELLNQWARSYLEGKRFGFLRLHEAGDSQGSDYHAGSPLRCERSQVILDVKTWLEGTLKSYLNGNDC